MGTMSSGMERDPRGNVKVLVGDVGGTKTDLAVVSTDTGPRHMLATAALPSASYPSLAALVKDFLARVTLPVDRACFDVAGPVIAVSRILPKVATRISPRRTRPESASSLTCSSETVT